MTARQLIESESPKQFLKRHAISLRQNMPRFTKAEIEVGTRLIWRDRDDWAQEDRNDGYYAITYSDHFKVDGFWARGGIDYVPRSKAASTHVDIYGVGGRMLTWRSLLAGAVKPDEYKSGNPAYEKYKPRPGGFGAPPVLRDPQP
jgi:hypothetical protein